MSSVMKILSVLQTFEKINMKKLFPVFIVIIMLYGCSGNQDKSPVISEVENAEHVIVYSQSGRFAGWPANNGIWLFHGNEILVGFTEAEYKLSDSHNAIEPYRSWLARSRDGGITWTCGDPSGYVGDFGDMPELIQVTVPIEFDHPEFALRVVGEGYHGCGDPRGHFFFSLDAGNTWSGPFGFGDLTGFPELQKYNLTEITPRTDYIITGKTECLIFMGAREAGVFGSDRLFCIQTTDGGQTFQFRGWVVKPFREDEMEGVVTVNLFDDPARNPFATECRAVMSESLRLPDGRMISVMRRKYDKDDDTFNWLDAYVSADNGATWSFLSYVAGTGMGNGNPPAIELLTDGRLAAVYGERTQGTIQVVYSSDLGKSWSAPQILMQGFWSEDMEYNDLGYPRLMQRADGKLVAVYYYSTREHLHHLRATIWQP